MRKISNERLYIIMIALLIFGMFQASIGRIYGFSLYPDEFGYWASAGRVAGYDWSGIASLGSYYSFGYSLILIPILFIFKAGVTAYRVAIAVNYVMVFVGFVILYKISGRVFEVNYIKKCLICAFCALYPPLIMYSQMTMAETELVFLFILLSYLIVEYAATPSLLKMLYGIVVCIYMYSVHMRTVGVTLSAILIYVFIGLSDKRLRRYILILMVAVSAAVLIFLIIRRQVIADVFTYASEDELAINGYGSQWWKIRHILTSGGFKDFLTEFAGKIYYLVISSLGIFIMSVIAGVKGIADIVRGLRRREDAYKATPVSYLSVFVFISILAEIMISSIYMHGSYRADSLFYGRYDEFILPVAMLIGVYETYTMCEHNGSRRALLCYGCEIVFIILLAPIFTSYLNDKDYEGIRGFFVSGIGYLNSATDYSVSQYMRNTVITGIVFVIVTAAILLLSHYISNGAYLIILLLVTQIFLGFRLSEQWTYRINSYLYPDFELIDRLTEETDRSLYYLDLDDNYYIDFIRFNMPMKDINVIGLEDLNNLDMSKGYIIINWNYSGVEELARGYKHNDQYSMFDLIYD